MTTNTTKLGLNKPDVNEDDWGTLLNNNWDMVEAKLAKATAGTPAGSGDYLGQFHMDTTNGFLYWWNGTTWGGMKVSFASQAQNSTNLNNQPAAYYTDIVSRLGYTPLNRAGDTVAGNLEVSGTTAFGSAVTFKNPINLILAGIDWSLRPADGGDAQDFWFRTSTNEWGFDTPLRVQGQYVWHGGNDGAGSGLDADLLDGAQRTAFVEKTSTNRPGVTKLYRNDGDSNYYLAISWDAATERWRMLAYDAGGNAHGNGTWASHATTSHTAYEATWAKPYMAAQGASRTVAPPVGSFLVYYADGVGLKVNEAVPMPLWLNVDEQHYRGTDQGKGGISTGVWVSRGVITGSGQMYLIQRAS